MPTYQYACTECGEQLEVVQKFSDDPLTVHDACGGRLRKVFSPVGIVFKGSGFYRTDSRNGSVNGSKASETKDASPAKSESSSDIGSSAGKADKATVKSADKPAASSGSSKSSGEKAA
ncbi:MAG: FmdB family transcriptional regulator [Streptosporangiaceae bacterium]|nr:FmdB family transcriptional regulator [Streptosporangiaceae bacterium]